MPGTWRALSQPPTPCQPLWAGCPANSRGHSERWLCPLWAFLKWLEVLESGCVAVIHGLCDVTEWKSISVTNCSELLRQKRGRSNSHCGMSTLALRSFGPCIEMIKQENAECCQQLGALEGLDYANLSAAYCQGWGTGTCLLATETG